MIFKHGTPFREWTTLNEMVSSLDVTLCSKNTKIILETFIRITLEDSVIYCVKEPECKISTAYECVWGLQEYAYYVMSGQGDPAAEVEPDLGGGDEEVVTDEFIFTPPPYELKFCE
jgi:hypothetical protein